MTRRTVFLFLAGLGTVLGLALFWWELEQAVRVLADFHIPSGVATAAWVFWPVVPPRSKPMRLD